MRKAWVLFFSLVFGALSLLSFLSLSFLNSSPQGGAAQTQTFVVTPGESFGAVARRLEQAQLITDAWNFKVYARLSGRSGDLRVGDYSLNGGMYPKEVLDVVTSGVSIQKSITFQEGLNLYEMAEIVEARGLGSKREFLKITSDQKLIRELLGEEIENLEGYLFPETYNYTRYTELRGLVKKMVQKFLEVYSEVEKTRVVTGLSRHQMVTFASIVEKETGAAHERPLISSVFHNRLRRRMRLQTDPTVLYGILDKTGKMPKNIRKADLKRKNRYNTYTFRGLPFGPISNPGRDSLKYAGRPASSEYLYFVSRNDGTHVFSKNYADHKKAVAKFQLNRAARQGKSWRDLNRSK